MRISLTPDQQRTVAEGVRRGDRHSTELLLAAFKPLRMIATKRLAQCYGSEGDYDDAAMEVVIWTIELTRQWDPEKRNLDGFLKEYLRYKLLDRIKQLIRRSRRLEATNADPGCEPVSTMSVAPTDTLEERVPDEQAKRRFDDRASQSVAREALDAIRAVLIDDYERAMFELKLRRLTNAEIGERLGKPEKKIRNDWSRRLLPRIRPILTQCGIAE